MCIYIYMCMYNAYVLSCGNVFCCVCMSVICVCMCISMWSILVPQLQEVLQGYTKAYNAYVLYM